MRSLAHTVPSRLVIPFGVWISFNFGNTLLNLLFIFGSDSHSSCSKLLILLPKSKATIVFEASFSDRASSLPFMLIWLGNPAKNELETPREHFGSALEQLKIVKIKCQRTFMGENCKIYYPWNLWLLQYSMNVWWCLTVCVNKSCET